MNWNFLISLLKGSNIHETFTKIFNLAAGFLAASDPDKQGTDDLLAGCLLSISDGIAPPSFLSDHQLARLANHVISRKSRISRKPRRFEKMPITGIVELCIC